MIPLLASAILVTTMGASAADPAAAQALFTEARQKMQAGDYAHACPLLEESERVDPAVGTLYNLADCQEHLGKTATAWALFLEVADKTRAAGQSAREQAARDRAAALASRLSRVVVVVPGERPAGLVVKRDGAAVSATQWGLALPVDPGPHGFVATAPGRRTWHKTVEVSAGGATTTLTVPDLATEGSGDAIDPRDAAFDPAGTMTGDGGATRETTVDASSGPLSTRRTVGAVMAGAGAVGLVLGTTFGIVSWAKHSESNGGCSHTNVCTAPAGAARNDAISAGNVSTAAFVVGLGLAAAGAVVWLTEPAPTSATGPHRGASIGVAPCPGGASLVGTF